QRFARQSFPRRARIQEFLHVRRGELQPCGKLAALCCCRRRVLQLHQPLRGLFACQGARALRSTHLSPPNACRQRATPIAIYFFTISAETPRCSPIWAYVSPSRRCRISAVRHFTGSCSMAQCSCSASIKVSVGVITAPSEVVLAWAACSESK